MYHSTPPGEQNELATYVPIQANGDKGKNSRQTRMIPAIGDTNGDSEGGSMEESEQDDDDDDEERDEDEEEEDDDCDE